MKIAIAQMRVKSYKPHDNFSAMTRIVDQVKGHCDLVVFPEMCIGGYFIGDKYSDEDYINELLAYNERIKELSDGIAIIWGNVYREEKLYNAAYFAGNKQWVVRENSDFTGIYLKYLLPNYGVFDDERFFEPGYDGFGVFLLNGHRIGLQICEDLWDENSAVSPTQETSKHDPEVIINLSCSPWIRDKEHTRKQQILRQKLDIPLIYVNCVGMQNNGKNVMLMDGNSQIVQKERSFHLSDDFTEDVQIVDLNDFHQDQPALDNKLYRGIIQAARYFDEEVFPFKPNWIVGVSGGLDSSVSVALLVAALGKERVVGANMPGSYNRDITKSNAYHLSQKLGFKYLDIPITDMVTSTLAALNQAGYHEVKGLAYENIQARLRGHVLMSLASLENGVVVNNGNKVEIALGYATLYGDAIGAISLIGDLSKLEIGVIARSINELAHEAIIPENLIPTDQKTRVDWVFAPSAELAQDQFDPMKWGYHDCLIDYLMDDSAEKLLEKYLDGSIYDLRLGGYLKFYGLDDPRRFIDDLEWVMRTMQSAVYKRIQMPPIVVVSDLSYGSDLRESQLTFYLTERFKQLKEKVLELPSA